MTICECFDFPCSWTFYRDHCIREHGFDPCDNNPTPGYTSEIPTLNDTTFIPEPETEDMDFIQQIANKTVYLENKLNEHIARPRKKSKWD